MRNVDSAPSGSPSLHVYPPLLLIDSDERRAQCVARLLTLTGFHVYVATTPFNAFERALQEQSYPLLLLVGLLDNTSQHTLNRLMQRLIEQQGRRIPVLAVPASIPAETPLVAVPSSPFFHQPSRLALDLVQGIWQALPALVPDLSMSPRSQALETLPIYGLKPRVSQRLRSRNSHFRQVLSAAQRLLNPREWETLLQDVGLSLYRDPANWPPNDDEYAIPPEYLSLLNQAVLFSRPSDPVTQLRRWSAIGSESSLRQHTPSMLVQQTVKLLPKEQVMSTVLNGFVNEMNEIRGEDLHAWAQRPDGGYWIVHYSNLYAYGRLRETGPACHVWLASLEATLGLLHLDRQWRVREVECSCQTLTGHCVFALDQRDG